MMCRLIRQLMGKGRRAAAVDEELYRHHSEHARVIKESREEQIAVEKLVRQFQRDAVT